MDVLPNDKITQVIVLKGVLIVQSNIRHVWDIILNTVDRKMDRWIALPNIWNGVQTSRNAIPSIGNAIQNESEASPHIGNRKPNEPEIILNIKNGSPNEPDGIADTGNSYRNN